MEVLDQWNYKVDSDILPKKEEITDKLSDRMKKYELENEHKIKPYELLD